MPASFRIASFVPCGLIVESETRADDEICLTVRAQAHVVPCPVCATPSRRIHSRYMRRASDLPCSGVSVRLRIVTRRFCCEAPHCPRRIFAERFDDAVLSVRSRRTARLEGLVHHLGLALGGRPAAAFAKRLMLPVSNDTLLRVVRRRARSYVQPLRVIGIDDWAFRKNHRYGSIICDLERRRIVALLPDRERATVEAWLAAHPEIDVVSRDRGGGYGEAAARASPFPMKIPDPLTASKPKHDASNVFHPPAPSRASRQRPLRGRNSHRGSVPLDAGRGVIDSHFESDLECKALLVTAQRDDVIDVIEQPHPVKYLDEGGTVRWWTFDQLVIFGDGRRCLVEVKPREKAMRRRLLETLAHIAPQIPPNVATHVTTITERDLPPVAVADARLFNVARRHAGGDDDALRAIIPLFVGAVSIATLVEASGLGFRGFWAIVRLVRDGTLQKSDGRALGHGSLVVATKRGA